MEHLIITSLVGGVCYIAHVALKWHAINLICKNNLSDSAIAHIANIVKQFQFRIA